MRTFHFYRTAPTPHVRNHQRPAFQLFPNQTTECDCILKKIRYDFNGTASFLFAIFIASFVRAISFNVRFFMMIQRKINLRGLMTCFLGDGMTILSSSGI